MFENENESISKGSVEKEEESEDNANNHAEENLIFLPHLIRIISYDFG